MYHTIHNKIRFMIRKVGLPMHNLHLDLITIGYYFSILFEE